MRQRQDLLRHLGKAHAQLLSHRAPRSTRIPHALSRITDASAAKPSHCILHCARRCRLLGASVGALNARCDAAALNSAVSNEEVDAKLDAWEVQGARIRNEARRLQREGAAET